MYREGNWVMEIQSSVIGQLLFLNSQSMFVCSLLLLKLSLLLFINFLKFMVNCTMFFSSEKNAMLYVEGIK